VTWPRNDLGGRSFGKKKQQQWLISSFDSYGGSYTAVSTMPIDIIGRKSLLLID